MVKKYSPVYYNFEIYLKPISRIQPTIYLVFLKTNFEDLEKDLFENLSHARNVICIFL